jgi:ribosomal protein L37AE/L43A
VDDSDEHEGHELDHDTDSEEQPDISEWSAATKKTTCPACGASGALTLGGGIFCPACGEVTTNPGYTPGD